MSEETERTNPSPLESKADSSAGERSVAAPSVAIAQPTDKWSVRRAELKKQKRRAHRRRINASNTSG